MTIDIIYLADQIHHVEELARLHQAEWGHLSPQIDVDTREPLNNSARSAFQSEKPQIVYALNGTTHGLLAFGKPAMLRCLRCDASDSSRSYGRVAQRTICGFSGETLTGRAFSGSPPRLASLIWNDQTALAQAEPAQAMEIGRFREAKEPYRNAVKRVPPAKAPSRPRRVIQRFPRASRLVEDSGRSRIPSIFIAVDGSDLVGSAALVKNDMKNRPELSPWLAAVYVKPARREEGIASSLISRVESEAIALRVKDLYLVTEHQEKFYGRRGWSLMEKTDHFGTPVMVMKKAL